MTARAELILGLRGNLVEGLQKASRQFTSTSQLGQRSMLILTRSAAAASRALDLVSSRYGALAGGAAAVGASRFVISQERRLTRLGIAANLTAEQVARLNAQIYETATAPNIRVDPFEILTAIEAIVEKTGDLEFAQNNLENIALAIQATGASGDAVGELVAEIQKLGELDPKNVLRLLDTLNVQGKTGAFTLKDLAALGPRVMTAYSSSVKGVRDNATVMREMGAALQVIRQGTGSSEQAATAFERLLSELQSAEKQKLFKKLGVEVFQFGQDGTKALRPINELMLEFLAKTGGDRTRLGGLFGDESIRAFNALRPELMQAYMDAQGDGTQTMQDSARAARDAAGAMQNLSTAWKQFADTNLTPVIQDLADGLNSIGPGTVQNWMRVATQIAVVIGGVLALRKILQIGRGIAGVLGGAAPKAPGGFAAGAAGALGGSALPVPVFVVNKNMSLLPGSYGAGASLPDGAAGGAAAGGRWARLAKGAGMAGLALAGGYGAGTVIYKAGLEDTKAGDVIGASIARALALFGNDEAQAAIERTRAARRAEAELQGELRIRIDQDGMARVSSVKSSQPGVNFDVYSGPMRLPQ